MPAMNQLPPTHTAEVEVSGRTIFQTGSLSPGFQGMETMVLAMGTRQAGRGTGLGPESVGSRAAVWVHLRGTRAAEGTWLSSLGQEPGPMKLQDWVGHGSRSEVRSQVKGLAVRAAMGLSPNIQNQRPG